jgi:hypothetical protein
MPYYNFDLVIGQEFKNQGGLILEDLDVASNRAEQLAIELCIVLAELKTRGCAVRVTDCDNVELDRANIQVRYQSRQQSSATGTIARAGLAQARD